MYYVSPNPLLKQLHFTIFSQSIPMVVKRHTFLFDLHLWRFYVNSLLTRILSNFLFMKHRNQRPFSQNERILLEYIKLTWTEQNTKQVRLKRATIRRKEGWISLTKMFFSLGGFILVMFCSLMGWLWLNLWSIQIFDMAQCTSMGSG